MKIGISLFLLFGSTAMAQSYRDPIRPLPHSVMNHGGIIRMDTTTRHIYLLFTGHEFADGGNTIINTLRRHKAQASFFFTGDFYRNANVAGLIRQLKADRHYLGAHSDKHLLYCSWEKRDSLLIDKNNFDADLKNNYAEMKRFGIQPADAPYFMPPYEWYNDTISQWTGEAGFYVINFTPGTSSNADYTIPEMTNYISSDTIFSRILRYESTHPIGMNGFLLLTHIGTDERRKDKFYNMLDRLLSELKKRGYTFKRL